MIFRTYLLFSLCLAAGTGFSAPSASAESDPTLLKKIYELRMRFERERAQKENEARANVRLVTQTAGGRVDSPTVTGLRNQTNAQLVRYEQSFRCLDVDVESEGGNTVVICGDNSGDISGSNTAAGRDIVTGGTPRE